MAWRLEFYQIDSDGTRTGGQQVVDASESVAAAIAQAQSMMRDAIFTFGRANLCLIKTQNGRVLCEVRSES